jgi:MCM N-terminal domain
VSFKVNVSSYYHVWLRRKSHLQCFCTRFSRGICTRLSIGERKAFIRLSSPVSCRRRVHLPVSTTRTPNASFILLTMFCIIRDKLRGNLLLKQHQLEVDLRHVSLYNDELAHAIQDRPADILPLVSTVESNMNDAILRVCCSLRMPLPRLHAPFSSHSRMGPKNAQKPLPNRYPKYK